ncbi:unnamed protein product, partial [Rotaria sp. Silwood2]
LHNLIKTGSNKRSLQRLKLSSDLFTLYKVDDQTQTSDFLIKVQEKARQHESITTLAELQALLEKYDSFTNLNRQLAADGSIIWKLKIEPSVLENINDDTLHHFSKLSEQDALFFRYFSISVIPFLKLYARQTDLDNNILCSFIISITMSSNCIVTALCDQKKLIRVHEKELFVDIEMEEDRWLELTRAFDKNRHDYGYSSFF